MFSKIFFNIKLLKNVFINNNRYQVVEKQVRSTNSWRQGRHQEKLRGGLRWFRVPDPPLKNEKTRQEKNMQKEQQNTKKMYFRASY